MEKLQNQISKLLTRKQKLESKRSGHLIKILNRCCAYNLPTEVLAGAVIDSVRAVNRKDKRVSQWEIDGRKILKPSRGQKKFV